MVTIPEKSSKTKSSKKISEISQDKDLEELHEQVVGDKEKDKTSDSGSSKKDNRKKESGSGTEGAKKTSVEDSLQELLEIFKTASDNFNMEEKIDELLDQNRKIAQGILRINEKIESLGKSRADPANSQEGSQEDSLPDYNSVRSQISQEQNDVAGQQNQGPQQAQGSDQQLSAQPGGKQQMQQAAAPGNSGPGSQTADQQGQSPGQTQQNSGQGQNIPPPGQKQGQNPQAPGNLQGQKQQPMPPPVADQGNTRSQQKKSGGLLSGLLGK